jgi:signal transduction histidine kinase
VLSNPFLNALDALPEQDAKFRVRIRIIGKRVRMAIADNGQGIPTALRASLFKPYATGKSKGPGSDWGSQGKSWTDTVELSAFVALDGSATAGRSFC